MRRRGFESGHRREALVWCSCCLTIRHTTFAPMRAPTEGWSAAACRLAMAEVRVRLPLGAFKEQDVGKPGIPPGTVRSMVAGARDHAARGAPGSNPAVLTLIAVGPVLARAAPVKRHVAGSIPATAAWKRKGKPDHRDHAAHGAAAVPAMAAVGESGRAMSLEGSTRAPTRSVGPFRLLCPWPSGRGASLPSWRTNASRRCPVRFPQGTLSDNDRGSASGRPPGFEPGNGGSTPPPRACSRRAVSRRATMRSHLTVG